MLNLNDAEKAEMFDLAGRERNQVASDLTEYIMDESIPNARVAFRKARNANLGDDFWKKVNDIIDNKEDPQ